MVSRTSCSHLSTIPWNRWKLRCPTRGGPSDRPPFALRLWSSSGGRPHLQLRPSLSRSFANAYCLLRADCSSPLASGSHSRRCVPPCPPTLELRRTSPTDGIWAAERCDQAREAGDAAAWSLRLILSKTVSHGVQSPWRRDVWHVARGAAVALRAGKCSRHSSDIELARMFFFPRRLVARALALDINRFASICIVVSPIPRFCDWFPS